MSNTLQLNFAPDSATNKDGPIQLRFPFVLSPAAEKVSIEADVAGIER